MLSIFKRKTDHKTPFSNQVRVEQSLKVAYQQEAKAFGDRLIEAMRLSDEDVEHANSLGTVWNVGEWCIAIRRFAWHEGCGSWVQTAYAAPAAMGDIRKIGYRSIVGNELSNQPDPLNWLYEAQGTATILFPFADEARRILDAVESRLGESK